MADVSRALGDGHFLVSRFVVPNYWADPNSGVAYQVQVQVPQARMDSLEQVKNVPVMDHGGQSVLLRNVANGDRRARRWANTNATTCSAW